jgi:hypothetical protein
VKSGIHSLEQNAVKGLSSLFPGLGSIFGGGKRDGSSANNALFVQFAGADALGGTLPLGNLGSIASLLGGSTGGNGSSGFLSSIGSVVGGIGNGIGGLFGSIASFFGGFLADGGDAQPGRAYIVGEKRPELFMPRSAGTVVPVVPNAKSSYNQTKVELHIHGVTDADSFKKSSAQISSAMGNAVSRGQQRNGR